MKLYLFWNKNTVLVTEDINDQDKGWSVKFNNKDDMIKCIRRQRCEHDNLVAYDQISDDNGNFEWQLIDIKEI